VSSVDWLVILAIVGIVLAALIAIVVALAAGAADREREPHRSERVAVWQAGYTDADLRALAGMAAAARAELDAGEIEVVLAHAAGTGDGVVVTGSRLPAGRLGRRIARGDGLAGRGLSAGRTTLAGLGGPAEPDPTEGLVAMSVPIVSRGSVVGVVTAAVAGVDRLFGTWHVARLEALAEEAGRRLGPPAGGAREGRETG
jgi:hypothetical protein